MADSIAIATGTVVFLLVAVWEEGRREGWTQRSVSCEGRPEVVVQEEYRTTCVYGFNKAPSVKRM